MWVGTVYIPTLKMCLKSVVLVQLKSQIFNDASAIVVIVSQRNCEWCTQSFYLFYITYWDSFLIIFVNWVKAKLVFSMQTKKMYVFLYNNTSNVKMLFTCLWTFDQSFYLFILISFTAFHFFFFYSIVMNILIHSNSNQYFLSLFEKP